MSNDGRHAGRGGIGAVMGAKNLKALSVRGSHPTEVFDAEAVVAAARDLSEKSFGPATAKYRELGTIANVLVFNRLEALPTRNFAAGSAENVVSAEELHAMDKVGRASCAACTKATPGSATTSSTRGCPITTRLEPCSKWRDTGPA